MKKADFEELNEPHWRELEATLAGLEKRTVPPSTSNFPKLFRQACGDLAMAQHRMYGKRLCERLNEMVIAAYQRLQLAATRGGGAFISLFTTSFPRAVRAEARLVWLSVALFFVPFAAFLLAAYFDPKWIYAALPPSLRHMAEQGYSRSEPGDFFREHFGSNFAAFGFYIMNNVTIHFQIFAGGVLCVVGGAMAVGRQGILLGATFGYVHHTGNLHKLYTFCASHSSFELLGFILGGAAGMRLGMAVVAPGRLTRLAALRDAGRRALPILCGSTAMIVVAAMIEAFWSPSYVAATLKYTVGISGWAFFATYFFLSEGDVMRLEEVSAQLRPRGNWESVDLGFAMVRQHFLLLFGSWFLTVVPLWLLLLGASRWIPLNFVILIIWWLKPIYDRVPLFILSRSLFGARPRVREVVKAWPAMLVRNFLGVCFLRVPWLIVLPRFSWARGLLLPVIDLERQRGTGFRERQRVLLDRAGNSAGWLVLACGLFEIITMMGLLALAISIFADPLNPGELYKNLMELTRRTATPPAWIQWSLVAAYLIAVTFVEILYVAGGFGLYLNCRTHLEGWDVEIAFRRLARRIGGQVAGLLAASVLVVSATAAPTPETAKEDAFPRERETIERVMKDEDFHIQTRKERKMRMRSDGPVVRSAPGLAVFGEFLFWLIIAAGVAWLAWLLYKNRHLFMRNKAARPVEPMGPRTVMGMEITPDSLPADLLGAARGLWQSGDHRGALSLLYRGSVAWLVSVARLGIRESDTEGDCLRHAGTLPNEAAVGYFGDLTDAWIGTAYASHAPANERMERLLGSWPFSSLAGGKQP